MLLYIFLSFAIVISVSALFWKQRPPWVSRLQCTSVSFSACRCRLPWALGAFTIAPPDPMGGLSIGLARSSSAVLPWG